MVVSYQLTWAPYVSEYSRYLPPETKTSTVFWWTYWGSVLGGIPFLVGAFIISAATDRRAGRPGPRRGQPDLLRVRHDHHAAAPFPGLIAVTAMNMYSGGLSTLTTVDTVKRIRPTFTARWVSIGFITVVGTVLALTLSEHFLENFNNFLFLILYFMIPWTAVNLIDFFYVRKGNYAIRELFIPRGMYGMWSWRGLLAYAIAFVAMIPFMSTTIYEGPIAKSLSGGDISPFIGFPIAAGLYFLFSRNIDVAAEARVAAEQKDLLETEAMAHEEIGEETGVRRGRARVGRVRGRPESSVIRAPDRALRRDPPKRRRRFRSAHRLGSTGRRTSSGLNSLRFGNPSAGAAVSMHRLRIRDHRVAGQCARGPRAGIARVRGAGRGDRRLHPFVRRARFGCPTPATCGFVAGSRRGLGRPRRDRAYPASRLTARSRR